jgi:hypothetical protein
MKLPRGLQANMLPLILALVSCFCANARPLSSAGRCDTVSRLDNFLDKHSSERLTTSNGLGSCLQFTSVAAQSIDVVWIISKNRSAVTDCDMMMFMNGDSSSRAAAAAAGTD